MTGASYVLGVRCAEVVVVMRERTPGTRELLERLPDLRLVVTSGMRNASIDLAACAERGVTVCGTASSATPPVELTWALVLGLVRRVVPEANALREGGPWQSTLGGDLAGATLGVVGLGKIGSRVAAIGRAFGMEVVAWSPHLTDERAEAVGVSRARSLTELLAASDVVTLHLVLSGSTRGVIGAAELPMLAVGAPRQHLARRCGCWADGGRSRRGWTSIWPACPAPVVFPTETRDRRWSCRISSTTEGSAKSGRPAQVSEHDPDPCGPMSTP